MKIKHIKTSKYETIKRAAKELSNLETGARQSLIAYDKHIVELCNIGRYSNEVTKLPKSYTIVYTSSQNLGTRKWACPYKEVCECNITPKDEVKETEKCLIVNGRQIRKDNIVVFVW